MTEAKFKKLTKDKFMKLIKKESVNEEDEDEELSQDEEDAWQYSNQMIDAFNDNEEMSIKDFKYYAYKFAHTMDNRTLLNVKSLSDKELVKVVADILDMDIQLQGDTVIGSEKPSTIPNEADRNLWDKTIKLFKQKQFKNKGPVRHLSQSRLKSSIEKAMGHEDEGRNSSELLIKDGKFAYFYVTGAYDPDYQVVIGDENGDMAKLYHINDFVKNKALVSDLLDEESEMMEKYQSQGHDPKYKNVGIPYDGKGLKVGEIYQFLYDDAKPDSWEDVKVGKIDYPKVQFTYVNFSGQVQEMLLSDFESDLRRSGKMKKEAEMKIDTTDIEELVSSEEGLTEGFKEKASIIFEAAVASKVKATQSLLKEQYATRLNEEVEVLKENLVEKIDSYLTYAVETWVNDNKVAVESTLRTEITESFIGSLKNLFTEHYIEVPESKVDLFSNMEEQVSSLKEQVASKGRIANALADRVEKLTRQKVIAEASAGLADTQIAKLTELVEDVEFINEATFVKKVATIREFYINGRAANKNTLNENVDDNASFISKETIVENTIEGDEITPSMQNYLSAMSRMNKATTANLVG